ncbi:MAG: hypothetical protein HC808_10675 [Candidatus Competibacteraceae bacterium]|nr:hypothetical protein [Candidatus Competibacteraceae bacterium]
MELGNVAHAFNRMASEISSREMALSQTNEQLTQSNTRLEKAVAHRTVELKRLLDTLKVSEANRRRLLADVSHELRTPLTIIAAKQILRCAASPNHRKCIVKHWGGAGMPRITQHGWSMICYSSPAARLANPGSKLRLLILPVCCSALSANTAVFQRGMSYLLPRRWIRRLSGAMRVALDR